MFEAALRRPRGDACDPPAARAVRTKEDSSGTTSSSTSARSATTPWVRRPRSAAAIAPSKAGGVAPRQPAPEGGSALRAV